MIRAVNHVAVTVTDIRRAMIWYREILGMTVITEPLEISSNLSDGGDAHLATLVRSVFGPSIGKFLICHMLSANGTGIELFEFLEPPSVKREDNFEYWKTGYFHFAITELHIEELAEKIAASGGRKRTEVMELGPSSGKKICFCEDPFGNVIEIYSHSYEQFWAAPR
jgi:catechol 2,3-dioxygenase-like lactoylglutathione lyase family enzyme